MRFEEFFDDLAAQADAVSDRALWDEAQELSRGETSGAELADRLHRGATVRLGLCGGHRVEGIVSGVGKDVLVLSAGTDEWLVPLPSLRRVWLRSRTAPALREEVRFRSLVRSLGRDRAAVRLALDDAEVLHGRLVGLGRDHLELAESGGARVLLGLQGVAALIHSPR